MTSKIRPIDTNHPSVFAFDISGEVEQDDIRQMAAQMNAAFDERDKLRMLLRFRAYQGQTLGSALDGEALRAEFRSLSNVEKYAVVGAPDYAETLIGIMDRLMPVKAKTFDSSEEDEAWAFVGARPAGDPQGTGAA